MKERIRKKKFSSSINIGYKDENGMEKIWNINQRYLIEKIVEICERYASLNLALTVRQLFYRLVSDNTIPNFTKIYKRICKLVTDIKYAGLIDWDTIEDRGRIVERHPEWNNIGEIIESATSSYRLPRWEDQEYYVEVYCEKQAMEGVIKPITERYHLHFGVNKGYSSSSTMYELAQRTKSAIKSGKKVTILYLGDHDPSGLDMVRDIYTRVSEFLTSGEDAVIIEDDEGNSYFKVESLALNAEQVKKYNLPPNPAKRKDPRSKKYIKEFGKNSWELDALDPSVLKEIIEQGIEKYIDVEKYNSWIDKEEEDKRALEEFGRIYLEREGRIN